MRMPYRCLVVASIVIGGALAAPAAHAATSCAGATTPCVSTSSTPDTVSKATAASTTYIRYQATIVNGGPSTMTHVVVTHALPAGTALQSTSTDTGTCTPGTTTCDLGNLASGQTATVTVNVTGPSTAGVITDVVDTTFTAGANPGSDPKLDITSRQDTTVSAADGQAETWLPPDTATTISTDPTGTGVATPQQSQIAAASIPATDVGILASLGPNDDAFTCPKGDVCRSGHWIEAHVLDGTVPATFPGAPLQFKLRWDKTLVPKKQTTKNFVVFYRETRTSTPVAITRCLSPAQLPCLSQITEEGDGDFTAVLISDHNGYMR